MKMVNIPKEKTNKYLNACIIFIFEKKNKGNLFFINEIEKLDKQNIQIENNLEDFKDLTKTIFFQNNETSNVTVITSDLCGLGKTFKIKKMIDNNKQKYFHLPLGEIISKKIITLKLNNILKKIKEEKSKDNYGREKNIIKYAIHLDLTESEEINILNEFFFSFLITKFYSNGDTIIYIPNDIGIYVEIPNCYKDYLSQFSILNIFPRENISLEFLPKLDLPQKIIDIFNMMIELNTNEAIEKYFLQKYMDNTEKYSYHQILLFINLFISHYKIVLLMTVMKVKKKI